jgi:hypothetical protein
MPAASKVVILHLHTDMVEWESGQICARTKVALTAAKARGVQLGVAGRGNLNRKAQLRKSAADSFAGKRRCEIAGFKAAGFTQRQMVTELNQLGILSAQGRHSSLI